MLEKLIEILERWTNHSDDENKITLNARCDFRLTESEKILLDKYCKLRCINKSTLIRKLIVNEINTFVNEHKEEIIYYN